MNGFEPSQFHFSTINVCGRYWLIISQMLIEPLSSSQFPFPVVSQWMLWFSYISQIYVPTLYALLRHVIGQELSASRAVGNTAECYNRPARFVYFTLLETVAVQHTNTGSTVFATRYEVLISLVCKTWAPEKESASYSILGGFGDLVAMWYYASTRTEQWYYFSYHAVSHGVALPCTATSPVDFSCFFRSRDARDPNRKPLTRTRYRIPPCLKPQNHRPPRAKSNGCRGSWKWPSKPYFFLVLRLLFVVNVWRESKPTSHDTRIAACSPKTSRPMVLRTEP